MFVQLSLKYRIAATVCVLQTALLLLTLHWTLSAFVSMTRTTRGDTEQIFLTLLRDPSRQALLTGTYEEVRRIFAQVEQSLRVDRVLLADATGHIVVSTTPAEMGASLPAFRETAEQSWRTTALTHGSGHLGVLAVEFSIVPLLQAQRAARNLGLRMALGGMVIIALVGVGTGFLLTRHFGQVTRAAQRFIAGEVPAATGLRGRGDVSQVGQAFDAMTEQISADRMQLEEYAARLHAILNTTVDAIITIDEQGLIETFNPAAERLFGYAEAAVSGQNVKILMPAPYRDEHDGYLTRYLQTGERQIIGIGREVMGQRKDGTTFPMELAVSEVNLNGKRIFTGIVRDISDRKQAEAALRQAYLELEARVEERTAELVLANEEVKRFAYIISHDLRAPLVNIKGFAHELRGACDTLQSIVAAALSHLDGQQQKAVTMAFEQDIPEALGFIDASASRMDRLIEAVLRLSRAGTRELHMESIDTEALVHDIVETLRHQLGTAQAQITVTTLPKCHADHTALEQIFGNLLSNAVTYLVPDRPGEIAVTAEPGDDETTFHVCDNGRGIAPDDIPRVFDLFRRVGRQDRTGEGMGLAYVQTLVRRHGGEIECDSTLGVGTTFSFTLPHHRP